MVGFYYNNYIILRLDVEDIVISSAIKKASKAGLFISER